MRSERLRAAAFEGGGLLALATLLLYAWLAPSYIVDGDNAEFATLGKIGGAAHPSGYPLYLLWLRATNWLPGTPAHAAALATAVLGAASIWVLFRACRAWGAKPVAATLAVVIFAGSPLVIRQGTRAEVFALNDLVVAGVLWFAANDGPFKGAKRAFALGLVAGLGISNNLTCVMITPIGVLGMARAGREAQARAIAFGVLGLAMGLLPYTYLLLTPETALSWGKVKSVDDLVAIITRRDYGGPLGYMKGAEGYLHVKTGAQEELLAQALGRTWLWLPLGLGVFTLGKRAVRSGEGESRAAWVLLGVACVMAGPLFASRFASSPLGLGRYVVGRFHVLPALLLAISVAVGFSSLARKVSRVRLGERAACALVATLGLSIVAALSLGEIARVHSPASEHYVKNVLRSLPKDAVLFCAYDGEDFMYGYVQSALGERPDVIVVLPDLLWAPWYKQRLQARGIPVGTAIRAQPIVDTLLARGAPVFLELVPPMANVLKKHASYPFGPVVRVVPDGAALPSLDDVLALNKQLYGAFDLDEPPPGSDDEFATHFHTRYAATWITLAQMLDGKGRAEEANAARELARQLGPTD